MIIQDFSGSAPSLTGQNLLSTIPSTGNRSGYTIQNQSTNQLTVAFDDTNGTVTPTLLILAPASGAGQAGGAVDWGGFPHKGRIRIFGLAGSQYAAAQV